MAYPLAKFAILEIIIENLGVRFVRLTGFAETHGWFLF
jgi:hypothetical protein